jgi:hypothetical protein
MQNKTAAISRHTRISLTASLPLAPSRLPDRRSTEFTRAALSS